jgi:hypothetical protein
VEFVSVSAVVACIAIGSGIVALWINVRFPKLMPWKMARLLAHMIVAFLCIYSVSPAMAMVGGSGIPAARLTSVFAVAFPVLVYNFLVGSWVIRLVQASASGFRA